jgi:hypothetical protein
MDYQKARQIRKTGLLSLINEELFENNKSVSGAVGGAISSRFKAKATGIKESLDPLNWVRKAAGEGAFGDLAVTGLGRIFGRKDRDIKAFGGYGRKSSKVKKDPNFTSVGNGPIRPLTVGDSVSDVLGKMYNFMTKSHQVYKIDSQIEQAFRQEQLNEDERRHKALVDAIKKFTGRRGVGRKKTEGDGGIGLLGGLGIGALADNLLDKLPRAGQGLARTLSRMLRGAAKPFVSLGKKFLPKAFAPKTPAPSMPAGRIERPTGPVNRTTRGSTGQNRMKETMKVRGAGRTAMPLGSQANYEPANKSLTRTEKITKAAGAAIDKAKPTAQKVGKYGGKALKGAKSLVKFLTSLPAISTALTFGVAIKDINDAIKLHEADKITEEEMHQRIVRSLGGALGATGGGLIGATVGAAFGPITSILGGVTGAIYAGAYGEDAADALYTFFTTNQEKTIEEKLAAIEKLPKIRQTNPEMTPEGAAFSAMHGTRNPKHEAQTKTVEPEFSKDIRSWAKDYKEKLKSSAGKGRGYSPNTQPIPKSSTVPEMQSTPTSSTGTNTPVVAVNNNVNNIGGKPPKVIQTASAKTRDSNIQYQIKNSVVPV